MKAEDQTIENTVEASSKSMLHLTVALSCLLGVSSLLGLCVFLIVGSFEITPLGLNEWHSLGLDAGLCLLFFIQHSGMIRRSFKRWLAGYISPSVHAAIYSVMSGVALLLLLVFWQKSQVVIWSVRGVGSWIFWGLCAAAILGFWWGFRSLDNLDSFGVRAALKAHRGDGHEDPSLTVRGPYRYVRHPLYSFALVMIWASPVVTLDRLLFAALWSVWIVVGTVLEERDLAVEFGERYREYQRRIPMLVPWLGGDR